MTKKYNAYEDFFSQKAQLLARLKYELAPPLEEKAALIGKGVALHCDSKGDFLPPRTSTEKMQQNKLLTAREEISHLWYGYYIAKEYELNRCCTKLKKHDYPVSAWILKYYEQFSDYLGRCMDPMKQQAKQKHKRYQKLFV